MTPQQLCDIQDVEFLPLFRIKEVCALLQGTARPSAAGSLVDKPYAFKVHGKTRWITRESSAVVMSAGAA